MRAAKYAEAMDVARDAKAKQKQAEDKCSRAERIAKEAVALASNLRWHAVYGAAVAVQAAERAIRDGTDCVDPDTVPRLVSQAEELADASERAWAELHGAKEQGR